MNICVSPLSLKLYSSYINREITKNLTESIPSNELLQNLFAKSIELLSDNKLPLERNKEIILQHFAITPSLILKQISDNPLTLNNAASKNDIDNAATIFYAGLKDRDFLKIFNNLNSLLNNSVIKIGKSESEKNNNFNAISDILTRTGNQEAKEANVKSNIPEENKKLEFAIIRNILNSNNKENLKLKLFKVSDIAKNKDFVNTIPDFYIPTTHVLVLVNSNNEIVKFNSDGSINLKDGSFTSYYYKTDKSQLTIQKNRLTELFLKSNPNTTKAEAEAKANEQIEDYINFINEQQKKVNKGVDVNFTINVNESSFGFINENRNKPVNVSDINNIENGKAEILMGTQGASYFPEIKVENSNKTFTIFGKSLASLSEKDFEILHNILSSKEVKTLNTNGNKDSSKTNNKLKKELINFYLQNSKDPERYGFRYYEKDGKEYVQLFEKIFEASKLTIDNLKDFAKSRQLDKEVTDKDRIKNAFASYEETTELGQDYKDVDGKVYERNGVRLNFSWQKKNLVSDFIYKVPVDIVDGVIIYGDKITYGEHIKKNGYISAQLNDENNLIGVGSYLTFEKSVDDIIADINDSTDFDTDFKFQSVDKNTIQTQYTDKQNQAALDWFHKSLFFTEKKLSLELSKLVSKNGPNFLASFFNNVITLYKGSQYTALYHESFHPFFDNILTPDEQNYIYSTLRKTPGSFSVTVYGVNKTVAYSDATNLEIQEYLAEKFKEYAISDGKKTTVKDNKIIAFFKKLLDLLKATFGNISTKQDLALAKTNNLENLLFSKLYNQEFDVSKYNATPQDEKFQSVESTFKNDSFDIQEMYTIMESMHSFAQELKIEALTLNSYKQDDVQSAAAKLLLKMTTVDIGSDEYKLFNKQLSDLQSKYTGSSMDLILEKQNTESYQVNILKFVKARFNQTLKFYEKEYEIKKSTVLENKINLIKKVLKEENFGDITQNSEYDTFSKIYVNEFIKSNAQSNLRLELEQQKILNVDNEYDENTFDTLSENAEDEEFQSWFSNNDEKLLAEDTVSFEIKELLSEIHQYNQNGYGVTVVNQLGARKLMPWKTVYSMLLKTLNNQTDAEKISEILYKNQHNKVLQQVYRMLGDIHTIDGRKNQTAASTKLWTNFLQAVVKASIPQVEVVINLTQNNITGEKIIESKVGNFSQERSNVKNIWNENFISQLNQKSDYASRNNDGNQEATFNTEILYNQYVKNNGKQYYGLLTGTNIIDDKGEIAPRLTDDIIVKNYWENLGVKYTSKQTNKALADPIAFLNKLGIYIEDSDIVRESFYYGNADFDSSYISFIVGSLKNRMTIINQDKTINNLYDFFKGFEFINQDGVIETQLQLNGILSALEQLHTRNSSEYTSFSDFNSENERVSAKQYYSTATLLVSNYNTSTDLEDFLSKPGMAYLDPEVNYTAASTNWFNNWFDFKTGRKKNVKVTVSNIGGSKIVVESINEEEEADPFKDAKQISATYEKGKKALKSDEETKLLSDILLTLANSQEIMRSETKTTSQVIKVGGEPLISINDINTINSDSYKNGTKIFDIFKNLIAAELIRINQVKKLINLIAAKKININDLVVNAEQLNRSNNWMQFNNVLSDKTKTALAAINISELKDIDSIKKNIKELIDKDLVKYIKNNNDVEFDKKYASVNLPNSVLEKYGNKETVKQAFLINNFIQNLNYQNLFLGDPSNFDIKGDKFFKRIHGMIASGKIFRNDKAYQDFINSDKFKPFEFSKLHLKDSEIKRDFLYNGEINTGVIDEIVSDSVYAESYDLFIPGKTEPYKNMEEANGQGYIGFELYRILSNAINEWSPAQENLYQKMLAFAKGEKVFFTEKEITNTTFPVKKFQLFGNVLNKESEDILKEAGIFFSQTAFHKYSLIPLVPLLINDSPALKSLNEKMMEQNIGYVTLKTGSKLSTLSKVELVDGKFKNVENKFYDGKTRTTNANFVFNKNTVNVSSLKSQKFIAEGYKKRIKITTQGRKITLLNIFNNDGVPYDYKQDKTSWENLTQVAKIKASNLYSWKNRMEKSLKTLSDTVKSELLEDIEFKEIKGKDGKVSYAGKTEVLLNYIINNLDSDIYLDEQKAFLKDADGNLISDVSTSLIAEKIEQVVVNLLAKKIRNIEIAGESLINVSGAMFEKTTLNPTQADLLKYGTGGLTTMYAKDKVTGEILKDKNGEFVVESMQVKIALQADFTKFLKTEFNGVPIAVYKQDENNKRVLDYFASLANLNKAIKDENWLKDNKALVTLPGVRIPVQGPNALVSVTVGEFLPYFAGPIVILPAEIVAMSGSDYDVDTIFMMYKNLLLVDNKVIEIKHDPNIIETRAQLLEEKNKIKLELTAINKKIDAYSTERKEELSNNLIINNFKFLIEQNNNEIINNNIEIKKIYDSRDIFLTKKIQLASEFEASNSSLLKENKEFNTIINEELKDPKYASLLLEEKNKNEELNNINIKIASKSTLGIENELQNLFSEIILMPSNFKHIITPNSTIDVKEISEDAFKKRNIKKDSGNPFEYHTNLKKHQEYSVGMDGLGKAAVAATFYALFTTFKNKATLIGKTQAEVDSFKAALKVISNERNVVSTEYAKAEKLIADYNDVVLKVKHNKNNGAISLGLTDNVDGKNIGNILSQLINAYVDIASDPFIYKAQGTKENTHVLLYMVMSGMSFRDAVSISNHPLIIEYNRLRKKYSGIFNVLNDEVTEEKNKDSINLKAQKDILNSYDNVLGKYMQNNNMSINKLNNTAKEFNSDELFEKIGSDLNKENRTEKENKEDAQIFALYLKINALADDLNSFIQVTRYDTKKIDSIQTAQEAIDDISDLKDKKKSFDNDWFDEMDNSTVGSFNQYQFFIDLISKNFAIRNNPALLDAIKRLKRTDIPIGTKKATIINQYKNDFMWFLYQNAVYTDNDYTVSSGEGYKLKPTTENIKEGYKINYEDKTIQYNEDTLYQKIFFGDTESIYSKAQVYFKIETPKSLARFLLEHDLLSEKYNNKSVSNEEFKEKFYQFDNIQTTLIEVEDDYSAGNRNQLIIRAALYNSGNVASMFTQTNGVNKMLSFFKQKYPDLNEYQFFQDMNVNTKKNNSNYLLNKTNMYFNNIKDAKAVAVYKKNIADLKNHEAAEVREFFKRFNHIALMQTGLRLGSKYDLAKLTDNNVFVEIIDDFIPMFKIKDVLSTATSDEEQSSFAVNSIISQFNTLFLESIKNGNHIDKVRGFDYTVNELAVVKKKSLKKIEGSVNNFSIINDVKSLEPGVELLKQVDILALYKIDKFESLKNTNIKYAILNNKILIADKRKQKGLDEALLTLGINNSEELPKLVYAVKDKSTSPIQIDNSKVKKGWYFVKDLGMAAAATKVIAQKIEPLTSSYKSSSNAYIDSIDKSKIADNNKVKFDSKDEVWVFGAGIFEKAYSGYKKEDYENKVISSFNNYYKVNIDAAIKAGVETFIVGSASGIDQYTINYLKEKGFKQAFVYAKAGNFFKFVKNQNSVAVQNQNFDPFGPVFNLKDNNVLGKILSGVYKNLETPEYFSKLQDKIVDESLKTKIKDELNNAIVKNNLNKEFTTMLLDSKNERIQIKSDPFFSIIEQMLMEKRTDLQKVAKPSTSVNNNDIYSQLENKNVVISNIKTKDGKYNRDANIKEAKANNRVYTMEVVSDVNSFSNPWASFNRTGTIKTNTTKEAVINYIDWLTTDKFKDVKPKRKAFILDVLKSGKLKGRQLQYYAELGEPSHATALNYLINKYDWNTQSSTSVKEEVLSVTEADEEIALLKEEIKALEEEDELTNESNVNVIAARLMPKITPESAAKETGGKVGTRGDIMLNLVDKNGQTLDEAAVNILGNWPIDMEERQDVTTSDIFDIIVDVLFVGKNAYIDSYLNTNEIKSKKSQLLELQKLQSTRPAAIINSWSDMNFTKEQEKEVLRSLIERFKNFNLLSNEQIINNFNTALSKAKTPEEKNKLIEFLNCK